jgi:hypothetical protein
MRQRWSALRRRAPHVGVFTQTQEDAMAKKAKKAKKKARGKK